ncbi:MAG: hypothetical protein BYD32DRAFT_461265 [Podila humilis]|nr:MAG: hypothetical protein BYD32DRAFT_461265 [Podila humilis]
MGPCRGQESLLLRILTKSPCRLHQAQQDMARHSNPVPLDGATYDANSRYSRSFKVGSPTTATVPHQATQLRHLDTSGWIHTRHASKLNRSNPHLTELKWVIISKTMDQDLFSTHLLTALIASLEKLQILSIEQLQACHTHYFLWLPTGLPSLKHLSIRNCSEIESCDAASCDESFPALTVLRLASRTVPWQTLSKNLRECCSRLISIECQDPYEAFQVGVMMTSDEYAVLIGATKALAHLEMPIRDLDLEIYQALMEHAPSLETLDLYICGDAAGNFSKRHQAPGGVPPAQVLCAAELSARVESRGQAGLVCESVEMSELGGDCLGWVRDFI